jgi:hypothetical protein
MRRTLANVGLFLVAMFATTLLIYAVYDDEALPSGVVDAVVEVLGGTLYLTVFASVTLALYLILVEAVGRRARRPVARALAIAAGPLTMLLLLLATLETDASRVGQVEGVLVVLLPSLAYGAVVRLPRRRTFGERAAPRGPLPMKDRLSAGAAGQKLSRHAGGAAGAHPGRRPGARRRA